MRALGIGMACAGLAAAAITFWNMHQRIETLESALSQANARYEAIEAPIEIAQQDIFNLYMQLGDLRQSVQQADPSSVSPTLAQQRPLPPIYTAPAQQSPVIYVEQSVSDAEMNSTLPRRADGLTDLERHRKIQQATGSFAPFRTDED